MGYTAVNNFYLSNKTLIAWRTEWSANHEFNYQIHDTIQKSSCSNKIHYFIVCDLKYKKTFKILCFSEQLVVETDD